jgi:anti-sigma factor RsiW
MKSDLETQQLNAFVDGELDLKSQLEIEQRTSTDTALRAEVEGLRQLRATVREGADYHMAPAALRQRMASVITAQPRMPDRTRAGAAGAAAVTQRWLAWRPMVASFGVAAVLALSLNAAWLRWTQHEHVLNEVVASHVRSTLGQHLVDIASSDHHTVKPWLSSKLGFSPPVSDQVAGSVFLGGRVDYLDGRPVAALAYRQGEHVVNAFLWPTEAADAGAAFAAERGFQIAHWSRNGMNHWVISDLNREEFNAIVRALEMADAAR